MKGLWADLSGQNAKIHMRTDANNLVTTAKPHIYLNKKETDHMINMLCHEVQSGNIDDLAHVVSADCLADCLTTYSANADNLVKAVFT